MSIKLKYYVICNEAVNFIHILSSSLAPNTMIFSTNPEKINTMISMKYDENLKIMSNKTVFFTGMQKC